MGSYGECGLLEDIKYIGNIKHHSDLEWAVMESMAIENRNYIGHIKHHSGLKQTVMESMVPRRYNVHWPQETSHWLGNEMYIEYGPRRQ